MKPFLLLILLFLPWPLLVNAQQDGLDPTFATNGVYSLDTGGYPITVLQPDHKILGFKSGYANNGAFEMGVKRFNQNGTPDLGFANNSYFTIQRPNIAFAQPYPMCVQQDEKIILAGAIDTTPTSATQSDVLLVRLQPNGSYDSAFGVNGIVSLNLSYYPTLDDYASSAALQADGKIVTLGLALDSMYRNCITLARFHTNGSIDSTFGKNGISYNYTGLNGAETNDVAIMPDGRIIAGAIAYIDAIGTRAFTALRLMPDGSLDTTFSHTGIAYVALPGLNYCRAMRLQPDGKVLLGGNVDSTCVLRFDTTGILDQSFGHNGIVKIEPGTGRTIALQTDGKILLSAEVEAGFFIYRLLANGARDNSFGNGGIITTKFKNKTNGITSIAVQPDGRILASGGCTDSSTTHYTAILARYMANGTLIREPELASYISIYPNPARHFVNIINTSAYAIKQIALYTTEGRLLYRQNPAPQLNLDDLPPGSYYLRFYFDTHATLTKKIMIR